MKLKQLLIIFAILLHLLCIGLLYYFFTYIAHWYLNIIPALGVDLYNSVTHTAYHLKNFSLPFNSFKDFSYAGYPLATDFPQYTYYAMVPFAGVFGLVKGVQVYVMFTLFLLLLFSYFLFYKLSRNHGFALLLATLVLLSSNIYGSATWGGSLPYFGAQFYLPLVLGCIISYFNSSSLRWFWAGALLTGIGFLFHPLPIGTFLFPSAFLLLFFYPFRNRVWSFRNRIKHVFFFFAAVFMVAFSLLYDYLQNMIIVLIRSLGKSVSINMEGSGQPTTATSSLANQVADFYKNQIALIYTGTNEKIFWLIGIGLIIFIVGIIIRRKRKDLLALLALFLVVFYVAGHIIANLTGHSFVSQGLYRAFWAFPIVICALAAFLWGELFTVIQNIRIKGGGAYFKFLSLIIALSVSAASIFWAFIIFNSQKETVIDNIHHSSDASSAFPEVLSLKNNQADLEKLKKELVPSFMDPMDKNKRLYESDATFNIWWNSLYDMPLVKGYIDPPIGTDRRAGIFLLDCSISSDTLVREFKYPEEMAKNYALYLIDWYGIYYFEGGHLSPASSAPPSSYLLNSDVFDKKEKVSPYGSILRNSTKSGVPEARLDLPQPLFYYKIKDEYTSPIIYGSNASTILVISDDQSFEDVWRALASENINSRFVVPVQGGEYIDDVKKEELKNFDAIILQNYSYHNRDKAFSMLSEYVAGGGKIFIDTGGEVKESESGSLPDIFPFVASERKELVKEWNIDATPDAITDGIDFAEFGPPIYNKNPWKFSYPKDGSGMKEGARVILKDNDKPLMVEMAIGDGRVIWSGMNISYHFNQYPVAEEGKFFRNIIAQLVTLEKTDAIAVQATWKSPEKVVVEGNSPIRGLLFKEEAYTGWKVKIEGVENANSKIYKTGPTYPGFMYVSLHKTDSQGMRATFSYNGDTRFWIIAFINVMAIIFVLELIVFNGRFVGMRAHRLYHRARKHTRSWWEKEEEY